MSSLVRKLEKDFLGLTVTLKLTNQKCDKILQNYKMFSIHANNITIREFCKLLGMLEAAIPGANMVIPWWPMVMPHQEFTVLLQKVNCVLMCFNYFLIIMQYKFTAEIFLTFHSNQK